MSNLTKEFDTRPPTPFDISARSEIAYGWRTGALAGQPERLMPMCGRNAESYTIVGEDPIFRQRYREPTRARLPLFRPPPSVATAIKRILSAPANGLIHCLAPFRCLYDACLVASRNRHDRDDIKRLSNHLLRDIGLDRTMLYDIPNWAPYEIVLLGRLPHGCAAGVHTSEEHNEPSTDLCNAATRRRRWHFWPGRRGATKTSGRPVEKRKSYG